MDSNRIPVLDASVSTMKKPTVRRFVCLDSCAALFVQASVDPYYVLRNRQPVRLHSPKIVTPRVLPSQFLNNWMIPQRDMVLGGMTHSTTTEATYCHGITWLTILRVVPWQPLPPFNYKHSLSFTPSLGASLSSCC